MLARVLHNPFVMPTTEFHPEILLGTLPDVLGSFLSGRWALLAPVPVALMGIVLQVRAGGERTTMKRYLTLCGMLVLPFVFSFLRRDRFYDRIFVNLVPVAALLIALSLRVALGLVGRYRSELAALGALGVWAYCTPVFASEVERKDRYLLQTINTPTFEHRVQGLYHNYYQGRYRPRETVRLTREFLESGGRPLPVFLARQLYKGYLPRHFLEKYGIVYDDMARRAPGEVVAFDEGLFITIQPPAFEEWMRREYPGVRCRRLNPEVALTNVYHCRSGAQGATD
jgi:hypothetical protein